jgi:hypothetical protein
MNPFKVGDVVERIDSRGNENREGVITSICPENLHLRFNGQRWGYLYNFYRLKNIKPEHMVELEDML